MWLITQCVGTFKKGIKKDKFTGFVEGNQGTNLQDLKKGIKGQIYRICRRESRDKFTGFEEGNQGTNLQDL